MNRKLCKLQRSYI